MKNYIKIFFNYLFHNLLYVILLAVFVAIDQVTKAFFTDKFIRVIDGVFSFTYSENKGAGWSILSGKVWLLIAISFVFLVAMFVFNHFKKNKNALYKTSFIFIVAGAVGNLADRLAFRYVRDFISFDLINFPIFNFADVCLTVGVILLIIYFIFIEPKLEKNGDSKNANIKDISKKPRKSKKNEVEEQELKLDENELKQLEK